MVRPFTTPGTYASTQWPGLAVSRRADHLLIDSPQTLRTLGNAVHGGGWGEASRFINWKVPLTYDDPDPAGAFRAALQGWGYPEEGTVGLMTAADLSRCAVEEEVGEGFALLCSTTVGVSNAVRAGLVRPALPTYAPGTINTFILLQGALTDSALVNALLTATEAKAAALQDAGVLDPEHGSPATGTSTDAVVLGATMEGPLPLRYAGTATALGNALGRLVYASVRAALALPQAE